MPNNTISTQMDIKNIRMWGIIMRLHKVYGVWQVDSIQPYLNRSMAYKK